MSEKARSIRRHQAHAHMMRRVKEDRNQHYDNLSCACYKPGKAMARFKEQPKSCSRSCCGNPRRWNSGWERLTVQERRSVGLERADGPTVDLARALVRELG